VNIVAGVAHSQAVALALREVQCSGNHFAKHSVGRESDAVDGPPIEAVSCRVVLAKGHVKRLVGRGGGGAGPREARIAPAEWRRVNPLRFAGATGV
jgi:hypothetical protein